MGYASLIPPDADNFETEFMTASPSPSIPAYQKLKALRPLLLKLHKALLTMERDRYERIHGPITSTGEFFQLVIGDEWFNWLRPLSQFIAHMDEIMWAKEPVSPNQIHTLLETARELIPTPGQGGETAVLYFQALENNSTIAELHGQVTTLLQGTSAPGNS